MGTTGQENPKVIDLVEQEYRAIQKIDPARKILTYLTPTSEGFCFSERDFRVRFAPEESEATPLDTLLVNYLILLKGDADKIRRERGLEGVSLDELERRGKDKTFILEKP
jgi:hypothetical protein